MQYKTTSLLARSKEIRDDGSIIEVVIWQLLRPVRPRRHHFKYRFFYGWPGKTVVQYDNERGKGDHWHVDGLQCGYSFHSIESLLGDFEADIRARGGL
jgi:hypothetical protein